MSRTGEFPQTMGSRMLRFILMMTSAGVLSLAGTIAFDFNSLANQTNDAVVQNYMNGLLSGIADKTHNGDRHIVRPGNGSIFTHPGRFERTNS